MNDFSLIHTLNKAFFEAFVGDCNKVVSYEFSLFEDDKSIKKFDECSFKYFYNGEFVAIIRLFFIKDNLFFSFIEKFKPYFFETLGLDFYNFRKILKKNNIDVRGGDMLCCF